MSENEHLDTNLKIANILGFKRKVSERYGETCEVLSGVWRGEEVSPAFMPFGGHIVWDYYGDTVDWCGNLNDAWGLVELLATKGALLSFRHLPDNFFNIPYYEINFGEGFETYSGRNLPKMICMGFINVFENKEVK